MNPIFFEATPETGIILDKQNSFFKNVFKKRKQS